ncbi:response regulator [Pseudorhodoferax soli]|uniref:Response regulator receiver domain-containing protein n=1 Tax=Pseudorhodoferax soli TaxID=545864 RepID=A0A368XW29_9BURK|nr:response regulator [Pseudorhodoferax soli]RCW71258.1 response regulator receiver domain-containing protein [Pseudorhodoferax soli]
MMLTIVVIEQDVAMRTLFCEWLAAEGYRVQGRGARGGAVEPGVHLAIVDLLNLPMQGAETVRQVRNIYPGAALIGISTQLRRTLGADAAQARALGVGALVGKPCTRQELLAAVVGAIGVAA